METIGFGRFHVLLFLIMGSATVSVSMSVSFSFVKDSACASQVS